MVRAQLTAGRSGEGVDIHLKAHAHVEPSHLEPPPLRPVPSRPIKVAQVVARLNIGGPAIHTILLAEKLNRGQFESLLVTGREDDFEGNMLPFAEDRGVTPIVIDELRRPISPRNDTIALARLVRLFRRERPDIVHTHTAKAGTLGRLAAKIARVPVVVHTFHGHVFSGYFSSRKTQLFIGIENALSRVSDTLITLDDGLVDELVEYRAAARNKFTTVPLGLDLDPFYAPGPQAGLREQLGLPENATLIGAVARMVPIKRLDILLDATAKLSARPDVHVVVVGDGEERESLERQRAQLGLTDRVHFIGFRDDMDRIYRDLDVVCLTSDNEGLPMSLIEATVAGCPVVATQVGGVPAILDDGAAHRMAAADDPTAFAAALSDLLDQLGPATAAAQAGRERAYQRFHIDRLVDDLSTLYRNLLEQR